MREKIALTRLQRLRNTDPIFYDHVIEAACEEIEKVETEVEAANPREEPEYYRGCGDACDRILALLRPTENPVGSVDL